MEEGTYQVLAVPKVNIKNRGVNIKNAQQLRAQTAHAEAPKSVQSAYIHSSQQPIGSDALFWSPGHLHHARTCACYTQ